jgi:hypothetical protein
MKAYALNTISYAKEALCDNNAECNAFVLSFELDKTI